MGCNDHSMDAVECEEQLPPGEKAKKRCELHFIFCLVANRPTGQVKQQELWHKHGAGRGGGRGWDEMLLKCVQFLGWLWRSFSLLLLLLVFLTNWQFQHPLYVNNRSWIKFAAICIKIKYQYEFMKGSRREGEREKEEEEKKEELNNWQCTRLVRRAFEILILPSVIPYFGGLFNESWLISWKCLPESEVKSTSQGIIVCSGSVSAAQRRNKEGWRGGGESPTIINVWL